MESIEQAEKPRIGRARNTLFRRLVDIVSMPSGGRLTQQDRHMAADILLDMLFTLTRKTVSCVPGAWPRARKRRAACCGIWRNVPTRSRRRCWNTTKRLMRATCSI